MRPLFALNLVLAAACAALNVHGVLPGNTAWKPSDNPVIVTANIEIPESTTLSIAAGTIVRFDGYFHILVKGVLEAQGSEKAPVEFTSNRESPAPEDWDGIIFYGEKSSGFLNRCKVRFAFKNFLWKASPVIQSCQFQMNKYAIYCSYSKAAKILDNDIQKNTFGVYCDFSSPIIQKNKITGNTYGIYCILSSAPVVGENEIVANSEKDIFMDEAMGKNQSDNINNHVWDLMKGLF